MMEINGLFFLPGRLCGSPVHRRQLTLHSDPVWDYGFAALLNAD